MAEHCIKQIERGDLIAESFVDGPAGGGVGGAGEGESIGEEKSAGVGIADIHRRIGGSGFDVTVAIEEEGSVPIHRNLHQVGGAVAKRASLGDDIRLGARAACDGKNENRGEGEEKRGVFDLLPHINSSCCYEVREPEAPAKLLA